MYSMIISLNLYNKYFKSIIHYLYIVFTRIKRLELLMIDLKSIVLPIKLYSYYYIYIYKYIICIPFY